MDTLNPYALSERVNEATTLYRLTDRLYRARSSEEVYEAALDAITGSLGCSRASILLFDGGGVMRFVASRGLSERYRTTLEGHSPWTAGQPDPEPIFVSNIEETDEPDRVKRVIKAENISALGFIPLVTQEGTVGKFMMYYEAPRKFSKNEIALATTIARQLGFSIERMIIEKRHQESELRFQLMSEHAPVMIWMSDQQGKCLHLNKQLRDFWGVAEEEIASFDWSTSLHPEDAPRVGETMAKALATRSGASVQARYRDARGRYRVLQTTARPRLSDGKFLGYIGVNIDVTEREEADAARRQAEEHRQLLVAELDHRVKNTLTVVSSIARQTFNKTEPTLYYSFLGRLRALSRSHDLLTQSNWKSVQLNDLVKAALHMPELADNRITVEGPPALLVPRIAISLSLALQELMTNALKYGALSTGEGSVSLRWTIAPDRPEMLQLDWVERDGPPVEPPTRSGFGTSLIKKALEYELKASVRIEYRRSGLVCGISLPL